MSHTIAIPVKKVVLHMTEITFMSTEYLPDPNMGPGGLSCDVIFLADGRIYFGYYHRNGYFYSGREYFAGNKWCGQGNTHNPPKDMIRATHWCYYPTSKVP